MDFFTSKKKLIVFTIILPILTVAIVFLAIIFGTKDITIATTIEAIIQFNKDNLDHQIIWSGRMPRILAVLFVGAFLGIAGALMQGITRNFLASPSILGVTDGSAFCVTLAIVFIPTITNFQLVVLSMFGSLLGAALVFGFASFIKNGLSPIRLAIIGTVIGTFLSSVGTAIAMKYNMSQSITMWYNSKLHTVQMDMVYLCVPIGLVGLIIALMLSNSVTILALGEETAVGLGQKTRLVKVLSMVAVAILTGTAVALVGKIGFIGLVVPHLIRMLVSVDYRLIIPCSAIMGAFFLAACDLMSRFINFPFETPVGVVTALIGVPFFLYLIRKKGGEKYAA